MHQAASDRWASLSFFSSNSAKRIVHHRDRPETARPSLVRRILFPWMAISLTSELVGGIVQGVQDGDEVFGPSGLDGVLANESVEVFCEGRHGAVLPAAMMLLARGGQFALGQIRRTAAGPTPSADLPGRAKTHWRPILSHWALFAPSRARARVLVRKFVAHGEAADDTASLLHLGNSRDAAEVRHEDRYFSTSTTNLRTTLTALSR